MSGDRTRQPALSGEVLPAIHDETHLPIEAPLSGIPLLNRMRYRAVRKELEEYFAVLRAKNNVLREITETVRIGEDYHRALVRAERIDDLRLLEHLRIDAELDAALDRTVERQKAAKIEELAHRARLASLEADAIEQEQRLEALRAPKPEAEAPKSLSERVAAEIAKLRLQERELVAALVGEFGSEDAMPEDEREFVQDVRLAIRNRIATLIDELNQ